MEQHEVMTPEEVAEFLRVTPQTVYRGLHQGSLPGAKVGNQWRILRSNLYEFLCGRSLDEPTAEELAESERAWHDYLSGRDPGESLESVRERLLGGDDE